LAKRIANKKPPSIFSASGCITTAFIKDCKQEATLNLLYECICHPAFIVLPSPVEQCVIILRSILDSIALVLLIMVRVAPHFRQWTCVYFAELTRMVGKTSASKQSITFSLALIVGCSTGACPCRAVDAKSVELKLVRVGLTRAHCMSHIPRLASDFFSIANEISATTLVDIHQ
jgi:hypothetical protein